ncbi:hypothetical protein, partial [Burkholderia multivorans]
SGGSRLRGFRRGSKGCACTRIRGLQDVGESRPLCQTNEEARLVRASSFVLPVADAQRESTNVIAVRIAAVFIFGTPK